jgi:hypothetical protein
VRAKRLCQCAILLLVLTALPHIAAAQTTPFQADGFAGPHPTSSAAPEEHVDPLSGNVLVAATDLVLPGNAGLDLAVQRFYSSQIFPDYENGSSMAFEDDQWAGLGWRLHFGRILHAELTGAGQTIVDLPGGGGGPLYHSGAYPEGWMTKGFARYNRSTNTLLLPNGLIYTFGQVTTSTRGGTVRYVTQIQDQYGNKITFSYFSAPGPTDGIQDIKQYLTLDGSEFREVTFAYDASTNGLASMTYNGRTWTYTQTAFGGGGRSLLQQVQPPVGPATQYAYDGVTGELTQISTASGGTVTYTYGAVTHYASTITIPDRVVTQRTTSGPGVTAGTWTFAYSQGSNKDQTVMTCACGTTKYAYAGTGLSGDFSAWTRGALADRQVFSPSGTLLEEEQFGWGKSDAISLDSIPAINGLWGDADVRAALPTVHTTLRNGQYWLTTYGYSGLNYNDHLNPNQINETGERARTTTMTYRTGLTPHILGRLASQTVTVGAESRTSSWTYDTATGFQTQATIRGVSTSFTHSAVGNVATVTDARGNVTTLQYDWGVPSSVQGPQVTQTRTVNQDGTPATSTVAGLTTTYGYDSGGRLTTIKPPGYASGPSSGWATFSYDSLGTWYRETHDTSQTQYNLDGFGRVNSTVNQVGLKTTTTRDACGRVTFQSVPYTTGTVRGVTTAYDALGRALSVTAPNGSITASAYTTNDVTVTDPLARHTTYTYSGAGTPDGVLASVTDANATTTTYGYNVSNQWRTQSVDATKAARVSAGVWYPKVFRGR